MFFEASCILQTIVEVNNNAETLKNDEHPDKIDYRAYRASILFQKLYFVLYSSLSCVGLKNVLVKLTTSMFSLQCKLLIHHFIYSLITTLITSDFR